MINSYIADFNKCCLISRAGYAAKARDSIEMSSIVCDGSNSNSWTRGTNARGKPPEASNIHPNSWQPTLIKPLINESDGCMTTKSQRFIVVDQDYMNTSGLSHA